MNPVNTVDFVNNLIVTCQSNGLIRADGQAQTLGDRIVNFFLGRPAYDHFQSACHTLASLPEETFSQLTFDQHLEIIGRFRQIQKKLKNEVIKETCDKELEKFEGILRKLPKDQTVYLKETQTILKEIKTASESSNQQTVDRALRKFDAFVHCYAQDQTVMKEIVSAYHQFTKEAAVKGLSSSLHGIVVKILLDTVEKIVGNGGDPQELDYPSLLQRDLKLKFLRVKPLKLKIKFTNSNKKEIVARIDHLAKLMKTHGDKPVFIRECLKSMNILLGDVFQLGAASQSGMGLSEMRKADFLAFKGLFSILNDYLPSLDPGKTEDQALLTQLKLRCANLPCPIERTHYPHLFLSEIEQVAILTTELQEKEDLTTGELVRLLKDHYPSASQIHHLAKLVNQRASVSEENRQKLKEVLGERLGQNTPKNWDDYLEVRECLKKVFLNPDRTGTKLDSSWIHSLKRISKAKVFFKEQFKLSEEEILIPRWYHATDRKAMFAILGSGKIQVRHEQAFKGAWVSVQRESDFGNYTISLSHRIACLDPKVFIGYQYLTVRRWRGLQKAVPLETEKGGGHIALIGVPLQVDKMVQKADKLKFTNILEQRGLPNVRAFSSRQLDFIQSQVAEILGAPNLSSNWWGRDVQSP
jgi:hypothetical protein